MYENSIIKDIKDAEVICITGHINPDGDCIGSNFAFAKAMSKLGKKPYVLLGDFNEKFDSLSGSEFLYKGDYNLLNPDVIFSIDCGDKARLGEAEAVFDRAKITYNLDHHISNDNFAMNNIVNVKASSSCEVVYEVISQFIEIDKEIATALYVGILTDTGGFRHNCTSERTHQIAGKLVSIGVDTPEIHNKFLMEHSLIDAKIFAKAISKMKVEDKIATTFVTEDEMTECGATAKNTDAIVGYLLNTEGVEVAIFASERGNGLVKLSFRSKSLNVNEVASLYGGGGHILAAGAGVEGSICKVLDSAISEVRKRLYEKR